MNWKTVHEMYRDYYDFHHAADISYGRRVWLLKNCGFTIKRYTIRNRTNGYP